MKRRGVWLVEERGHRAHPWTWDPATEVSVSRKYVVEQAKRQRERFPSWYFRARFYVPNIPAPPPKKRARK